MILTLTCGRAGGAAVDAATAAVGAAAPAVAWRDTLVVVAAAADIPIFLGAAQVVTRVDLGPRAGGQDLGDLLGSVAGLQVRRYGGLGSSVVPSIRGSAGAQVRVFIDGLPLESAETGFMDLARLPLERFSVAEVFRGGVPVGLGGLGGAGAVNLVTRPQEGGLQGRAFAGSFGDRGGAASWAAATQDGRGSLLVLAHARRVENDFSFRDHRQTFHRTDDDTVRTQTNAQWREWGVWTAGKWDAADLVLQAAAGAYRKEGGRPGPSGAPSPTAAVRTERQDGRVGLGWRRDRIRLDLATARTVEFLYDPQGEVQPGFRGTVHGVSEEATGRLAWSMALLGRPRGPLMHRLDLAVIGEARRQWFRQSYNAVADPLRARTTTGAAAEATWTAAGGRLRVVPAYRWQQSVDDFPPLPPLFYLDQEPGVRHVNRDGSPSLGAAWELRPGILVLEGHLSRTVRQPSWVELFGHRGGVAGNRELLPEIIESADLDLALRPADLPIGGRLAVFTARTDQAVLYVQNSPGTSRPVNAGTTGTRGLEVEMWGDAPGGFGWSLNGTWQRARDRSGLAPYDGKELPFLPAGEWWGGVHRRTGAWRPFVSACGESPNYRDRANTPSDRAPARLVVSAGVTRRWTPGWLGPGGDLALTVEGVNLTDNDVYDVEGFPLPGRSWHASLEIRR